MGVLNILKKTKISGFHMTFKVREKTKKEPSILETLIENPEQFKLEAFVENEEIIVKIKKKES